MPTDAELRKVARAQAEVRVFRAGEREAEADADALYWDRIPIDQGAGFVWTLSLEMHALADRDQAMPSDYAQAHWDADADGLRNELPEAAVKVLTP